METITSYLTQARVNDSDEVQAWQEEIMLPTYEVGEEEKNPMFLEKRVYQGSSGNVYPFAIIEKIFDEKRNKPYKAVFIENRFIKLMILPELGGRLQMAYDKLNKRHFIYYNQVIKPALVGLLGPWISGGIEFNWPQHHRPSTFMPTQFQIEEHSDGSKTIWCSEVERMTRTRGMHGFRLYPNKQYIEIEVKIYNRTSFPQTFLWWANPAVYANDSYRSVFPPDVTAVFDHGKRDVSSFPIAKGFYYKQDYTAGVDISRYKNIQVPTSYMAVQSKFNFLGGYQEDVKAGMLHIANHHISPGKKQWTWGNGDFGQKWYDSLSDEDGPYIELMTGVFTENQPDFSWLHPYEEKSWKQYFLPYSNIDHVKNANKDAIIGIKNENDTTLICVHTTSAFDDARIIVKTERNEIFYNENVNISPISPLQISLPIKAVQLTSLIVEVVDKYEKKIIDFKQEISEAKNNHAPAVAIKEPKDIASIEQLYLSGLHLEQYRHATYDPTAYYKEALRRDANDIRNNNALGLWMMRKGKLQEAQILFEKAVKVQTEKNNNPHDGEPNYNLGWCYFIQKKFEDAYNAFYKCVWNAAWQDAGYYALSLIDCTRNDWDTALDHINRALSRNSNHHKAHQLKASILRKKGDLLKAKEWIDQSILLDSFNIGCLFEKYLITGDNHILSELSKNLNNDFHTLFEYANDFATGGFYDEAIALLKITDSNYPIKYYAIGYYYFMLANETASLQYYEIAAAQSPEKCFPSKIEELIIMQHVISIIPLDAKALHYLGNYWYAAKQYSDAIECWEKSIHIKGDFPTTYRNLALAYYNKMQNKQMAKILLEKAFELDKTDARVLMELDALYKKIGIPYEQRLSHLKKHYSLIETRDDLFLEYITLINQSGEFEAARNLLTSRKFHPWEGGEGKVTKQYVLCHIELAKKAIKNNNFNEAINILSAATSYPSNLGEGKLPNISENEIYYFKGLAFSGINDLNNAEECFHKATAGSSEPTQAFFYNDQQPDSIFFQGLAWKELKNNDSAIEIFDKLITYGESHLFDDCKIDFFAVSLPDMAIWEDDLIKQNQVHCYYLMTLGYLGKNNIEKAKYYYDMVNSINPHHKSGLSHHIQF